MPKTKLESATLSDRKAARSWTPDKGSKEEQALELANRGVDFFSYSMKKPSMSGHATRDSSKAAFLAKLKDKSLHLCLLEMKEKRLLGFDGVVGVVAYFCDAKDPRSVPILGFEWEASPAKVDD